MILFRSINWVPLVYHCLPYFVRPYMKLEYVVSNFLMVASSMKSVTLPLKPTNTNTLSKSEFHFPSSIYHKSMRIKFLIVDYGVSSLKMATFSSAHPLYFSIAKKSFLHLRRSAFPSSGAASHYFFGTFVS